MSPPDPRPGSLEPEALQPGVEDLPIAQDLDALAVGRQAAGDHPEQVGQGGADGHGGLLVAASPAEPGGAQLDQPLGVQVGAGVGGVQVDGPGRPGPRLRLPAPAGAVGAAAEQVEELVDGVGGQVGLDREPGPDPPAASARWTSASWAARRTQVPVGQRTTQT